MYQYIKKEAPTQARASRDDGIAYTLRETFQKLCEIQETALALQPKPDFTAALKSEELKGKLFGLYTDKKEKTDSDIPTLMVEFVPIADPAAPEKRFALTAREATDDSYD